LLPERNVFQKLWDFVFQAKADKGKARFKDKLKKHSPDFCDAFNDRNNQLIAHSERLRKIIKRSEIDTSKIIIG
jgi:hypothetical protein